MNNKSGNMFDTFIMTGRTYPGGEFAESSSNKANYKDWNWYINQNFAFSGALKQLNESAKSVNKKVNVYISIPYPKRNSAIIQLNGKSVKNTTAEREKLVNWYINNIQAKWNTSKFTNITLKGYYWQNETVISQQDEILVQKVANTIHKQKKNFIYSPHSRSTNFDRWNTYGFDGAYLQPNGFRLKYSDLQTKTALHNAFLQAQINGSGINIEIDSYSPHNMPQGLSKFEPYVEMAERYGLPGRSLIMYQEQEMVYRMATYQQDAFQQSYLLIKSIIK